MREGYAPSRMTGLRSEEWAGMGSIMESKGQRYRWLWMPLLAFLITRLGIAAVAYFSTPIMADSNISPYHIRPDNTLLDVFGSRWDAGFYLSIADEGYQYEGVTFPSVAFFPLYPMLLRAVRFVTGDPLWAGLILSNLALLAAVILLYRLTILEGDASTAERTVWYLLIFPASFFGSAIYTEALFLLLAVAVLYLARKDRWWAAGLVSVLAALTRLVGVILAPMLALEWWQRRRKALVEGVQPPGWGSLITTLLAPLGTLAYMLYLKFSFGDPLAFMHASQAWSRQPRSPIVMVTELFTRPVQGWGMALADGALPLDNWADLGFVLFFIALGIVLLFQRRWSEGAFVLMGAMIPLSSGLLMSQRRYMWVLFPAFMLLGRWGKNTWVDRVIFVFSLLALGLFTAMYANWYWVG
jgi:Gpi18-like mannosyltransferase